MEDDGGERERDHADDFNSHFAFSELQTSSSSVMKR